MHSKIWRNECVLIDLFFGESSSKVRKLGFIWPHLLQGSLLLEFSVRANILFFIPARAWGNGLIFQKIQETESQKLAEILNMGSNWASTSPLPLPACPQPLLEPNRPKGWRERRRSNLGQEGEEALWAADFMGEGDPHNPCRVIAGFVE